MNPRGLRLILVTPWNTQSAIAGVNLLIAKELVQRGVAVTIVRSEMDAQAKLKALNTDMPILRPKDLLKLQPGYDYDHICYAIGNYWLFHGGAINILAQRPGLVLLHDAFLRDLGAGWEQELGKASYQYLLQTLVNHPIQPDAIPETIGTNSMVNWPMAMATGGVVHAKHYLDLAQTACPGPVVELPLPVSDINTAAPRKRQPGDPIDIVTIGHVNSNKLPEEIIQAIGSSHRLRTHCQYRLLGPIDDETRSRLESLADSLHVKIQMTGWLDEEHLLREIGMSDCVLCLRFPILEGASMSAIVALLSARPTIVCDAGFYSEIPDDVVIKLPARPQAPAIVRALETIIDKPDHMADVAARARVYALETFTASCYVDGLLNLIEEAIDVSFTVKEARTLCAETSAWGLDGTDPLFSRLSKISIDLFS
ncbi:glycosyltransferase [Seohaeicola saemankumensis]|uniref:Glycosyltransferase n=1 Tax=Seohaeicola saemankumensis TaxID=481181 RepID=A0ABW3T9T3_9RHOB